MAPRRQSKKMQQRDNELKRHVKKEKSVTIKDSVIYRQLHQVAPTAKSDAIEEVGLGANELLSEICRVLSPVNTKRTMTVRMVNDCFHAIFNRRRWMAELKKKHRQPAAQTNAVAAEDTAVAAEEDAEQNEEVEEAAAV